MKIDEFLLQDKDNKLIGYLDAEELLSAVRYEELNGKHTFEFSLGINHEYIDDIIKYNRILFKDVEKNKWYEFVIRSIEKDDITIKVKCVSSIYDCLSNVVELVNVTGNIVTTGLNKILTSAEPQSSWQVGTSDISGSFYMQRSKKSLKEVIWAWAEKVNGEIVERIEVNNGEISRYIDIKANRGADRGKVLYDDREITDINVKIPYADIYTAAFGYGKSEDFDGDGNAENLTFSDEVWTVAGGKEVDKPSGQKWVGLPESYKLMYGLNVGGDIKHRMTFYEFSDIDDPAELLQSTYDQLLENVKDKTEYSVKASDLKALGYVAEGVGLGDTVGIDVKALKLKLKAKVVAYKEDYLKPESNDFQLSSFSQSYTSRIDKAERNIKDLTAETQAISNQFRNNLIENWNNAINIDGAYVYDDPLLGRVTYDAPVESATKIVSIKGGSIRVADSKLPNGEWDFRTFLTGKGMIADLIVAGILQGGKVKFNLDTGEFLIGNSTTDYLLYFDGTDLKLGIGSIKWENLDSQTQQNLVGPEGPQGDPGSDGQSLYTWIKYADNSSGVNMSDDPTGKLYMGIAYNKTTATESADPVDYAWSLTEGNQGVPGDNGESLYIWIKYADNNQGLNMSDSPTGKDYIGLAYNKTSYTKSSDPADYVWSLYKGEQGIPGDKGDQGDQGDPGADGEDANLLDWVDEWNGRLTIINNKNVASPTVFSGTKDGSGNLNGVAIGDLTGFPNLPSGFSLYGLICYLLNVARVVLDEDELSFYNASGNKALSIYGDVDGSYTKSVLSATGTLELKSDRGLYLKSYNKTFLNHYDISYGDNIWGSYLVLHTDKNNGTSQDKAYFIMDSAGSKPHIQFGSVLGYWKFDCNGHDADFPGGLDLADDLTLNDKLITNNGTALIPAITITKTSNQTVASTSATTTVFASQYSNIEADGHLSRNGNYVRINTSGVYEFKAHLRIESLSSNQINGEIARVSDGYVLGKNLKEAGAVISVTNLQIVTSPIYLTAGTDIKLQTQGQDGDYIIKASQATFSGKKIG